MPRSEMTKRSEDICTARLVVQTRVQRDEAETLLASLVAAKTTSERNLAAAGQRDLLKTVTGRSSIDTAIEGTRRLVASFDRVLVELRSSLTDDELDELGAMEQNGRRRAS
ncbi:MAG: hypothetical protein AAF297_12520 [Planctomycetota bacterium]